MGCALFLQFGRRRETGLFFIPLTMGVLPEIRCFSKVCQ